MKSFYKRRIGETMNLINRYLLSLLVISFTGFTNHTAAQDESEAAIEEVIVMPVGLLLPATINR